MGKILIHVIDLVLIYVLCDQAEADSHM